MATTKTARIKLLYDDSTTRTYNFNGITTEQAALVKSRVMAINESLLAGTASDFANTFVSNNSSPCAVISEASIITLDQEVIYNAN